MEKDDSDSLFSEHIGQLEKLEARFEVAFRKGADKKGGRDPLTELQDVVDHYPLSPEEAPDFIRERIEGLQEKIRHALNLRQIEESIKKLETESQFIQAEVIALKKEKDGKKFLEKIGNLTLRIHSNHKSLNAHQVELATLKSLGPPFDENLEALTDLCNASRTTLFSASLGLIEERRKQIENSALSQAKLEKINSFIGYVNSNKAQLQREKREDTVDEVEGAIKQDYIEKLDDIVLEARQYYLGQLKLFHQLEMKRFNREIEKAMALPGEEQYPAIKIVQAAVKEHYGRLRSHARPQPGVTEALQGTEIIHEEDIQAELEEVAIFSENIKKKIYLQTLPKASQKFLQENNEDDFRLLSLEDKIERFKEAVVLYKKLESNHLPEDAKVLAFIQQAKNTILGEFEKALEKIDPKAISNDPKGYSAKLSELSKLIAGINHFQKIFFEERTNKTIFDKMGWSQQDDEQVQTLVRNLEKKAKEIYLKAKKLRKMSGKGNVARALRASFRSKNDPRREAYQRQKTEARGLLTEGAKLNTQIQQANAMTLALSFDETLKQIRSQIESPRLTGIEDIDRLLQKIATIKGNLMQASASREQVIALEKLETRLLDKYTRNLFLTVDEVAEEFKAAIEQDLIDLERPLKALEKNQGLIDIDLEDLEEFEELEQTYEQKVKTVEIKIRALDKKLEDMMVFKGTLERERAKALEKKGVLGRMKKKTQLEGLMEAGIRKLDIAIKQHSVNIHKVKMQFFGIQIKQLEAEQQDNPELILSDIQLRPIRVRLAEHKMALQRLSLDNKFVKETEQQMQHLDKLAAPDSHAKRSPAMTFLKDVKRRMPFGKGKSASHAPGIELRSMEIRTPATPQAQATGLPTPPKTNLSQVKGRFSDASFDGITKDSIAANYNEIMIRFKDKLQIDPPITTPRTDKLVISLNIDKTVPPQNRGKAEITKNPAEPTGLLFSAIPPPTDIATNREAQEKQEKAALQLMVAATKAKMVDSIRKDPSSFVAVERGYYPIEVATVKDLKCAIILFTAMLAGHPVSEISLKPKLASPVKGMVERALRNAASLQLTPEEMDVLKKSLGQIPLEPRARPDTDTRPSP